MRRGVAGGKVGGVCRNQIISSLLCHVRKLDFILSAQGNHGKDLCKEVAWLGLQFMRSSTDTWRIDWGGSKETGGHCRYPSEIWRWFSLGGEGWDAVDLRNT